LPPVSETELAIVAVYCVLPVRAEDGVNVAVLPLTLMFPITKAPPAVGCNLNPPPVNVILSTGTENVAETDVFRPTFFELLDGDVAETVSAGGTEGAAAATVVSPACSPPQPYRLRVVTNAVINVAAENFDLTFRFNIWELLN